MSRQKIEQQVKDFLQRGGKIKEIPSGTSGWDASQGAFKPASVAFTKQPAEHKPLFDVMRRVDERRAAMKKRLPKKRKRLPQPRSKIIYDDFGEPIRRVWVDK